MYQHELVDLFKSAVVGGVNCYIVHIETNGLITD